MGSFMGGAIYNLKKIKLNKKIKNKIKNEERREVPFTKVKCNTGHTS